jgi:hypothetical protein
MKALLIAALCAFAAGCADVPPAITASGMPGLTLAAIGDCGAWRTRDGMVTCRGIALPEQIIGEENHAVVLDGRS